MIRSRKGCCEFFCSFICFISDPTRIPAIAAGVGAGMVIFANRAGGYYKARIANQIPFEKVLRGNPHCAFSVNFGCFPFWYQENVSDITVTTSGTVITNPGSIYSEPLITLTGSGNITLMVGTTIVELTDTIPNLKQLQNPLTPCDTANGFGRNRPDRAAQSIDHFFECLEHFIAETSGANFTPHLLDGVHFGRVGRNVNQMDVIRHNQCNGFVSCGAVADQKNFSLHFALT